MCNRIICRRVAASPRRRFALCLLPFAFCLFLTACGKVGAPVPPTRFTERTADLSAIQRGNKIMLSWPAPRLAAKESDRSYIDHAEVFRLQERRDQEPVLDPDDFEDGAQNIFTLDRAQIEAQVKQFGRLECTDVVNLTDAGQVANVRLRYAIRYVNKRGQEALFSNTVAVEPVPGIALPPNGLTVANQDQDLVVISWAAPEANVDGTQPATVVGYNLYRRNAKKTNIGGPLNAEPITATTFSDTKFQYGVDYIYVARALSQGASGLIESADSAPLRVTPKDTFSPSTPEPVTIASANGVISLFWPSVPERDLAGYNVYRAASADAPGEQWVKLTPQPISPVTFRDDRVQIGQTYFYRVTAIDRFNNESKPSRPVGETAHP
ncbi:MAG: fibronectin type III domain-containing protein [Blastocatellia bacterium]